MTALASADVSVSIPAQDRNIIPSASRIISMPEITFGDGALTYPTGGVPLPDKSMFGFKKAIEFVEIQQPPANGFVYKYDQANHKIKIFTQGAVTGSTAAADSTSGALAEDSAGAETAVRLMGSSVDTTYDLGGMIELPATIAPAEVTLKLLMWGQ